VRPWGYAKLVVGKKAFSVVSLVALVLSVWSGLRLPSHPVVLPLWVWLAILAVSLMLSQFLVWRDTRVSVLPEDEHAKVLRGMA
jgi:hypothetical protein